MDHIVDQHHDLAADVGQVASRPMAVVRPEVQIVAVQRHVEPAEKDRTLLERGQDLGEALRKNVALADDADEHHALDAAIALHDLMGDARKRAADLVRVHDRGFEASFGDAHDRSLSRRAMRMCRPLRACRKYAARGSSSTSGAISSTRGSGCMRIAYLRISVIDALSIR